MLDIIQFDNSLKETLVSNSLLPLDSNSLWRCFEITFKYNENEKYTKGLPLRRKINESVPKDKRGLYVFVDLTAEEALYVGEGWIRDRLHRHIKKLYLLEKKTSREFFKSIQGDVRIYWTECVGYHRRIAIEGALQCVLKPRYRRDDH